MTFRAGRQLRRYNARRRELVDPLGLLVSLSYGAALRCHRPLQSVYSAGGEGL